MNFKDLPPLGAPLDTGTFAGLTTLTDGTHYAVVLLPEQVEGLTWESALDWAKKCVAELPSRPVASLLFANCTTLLKSGWHWTSEAHSTFYAWGCYFNNGDITYDCKSDEGFAVAVRLIPIGVTK